MNTKQQADTYARQTAFALKQVMYTVERNGKFFAASGLDLKRDPGTVLATFSPIKGRAGARQSA
jgi:hypothetical protein